MASAQGGRLRWLLSACGGVVALAGLLTLVSLLMFGSVTNGVRWLRGEPLELKAAALTFPPTKAGEQLELAFEVTNRSFRPVHLLGGTSDCSCVKIGGLPAAVPARTTLRVPVTVVVRANNTASEDFSRPVTLTTQLASQPRLFGKIEGRVLSAPEPAGPLKPVPDEAFTGGRDVTP
jgi:hypothetical protein